MHVVDVLRGLIDVEVIFVDPLSNFVVGLVANDPGNRLGWLENVLCHQLGDCWLRASILLDGYRDRCCCSHTDFITFKIVTSAI